MCCALCGKLFKTTALQNHISIHKCNVKQLGPYEILRFYIDPSEKHCNVDENPFSKYPFRQVYLCLDLCGRFIVSQYKWLCGIDQGKPDQTTYTTHWYTYIFTSPLLSLISTFFLYLCISTSIINPKSQYLFVSFILKPIHPNTSLYPLQHL